MHFFSVVQPSSGNETKTNWEIEVNAVIQPATDTGVLFALVAEETSVPLSLSLIDYHSTKKLKRQVHVFLYRQVSLLFPGNWKSFSKTVFRFAACLFICPTCSEHGLRKQYLPDTRVLPLTGVCHMQMFANVA